CLVAFIQNLHNTKPKRLLPSPREGPSSNLQYKNPISQKAKLLIRRISQGLRFGVSVHIPPAITTYDVQINSMPC
ncbi:MAG: hypothetical protein JXA79_05585, partial [Deltaproteobacteria bacterium]|nr:hypothetical protein [Deltaproteobacteria bacterium]